MTSKVFQSGVVIDSSWLNDVNTAVYATLPALATTVAGKAAAGANGDITSLASVTSYNGGASSGLHNKVINGGFWLNQRAVSGSVVLTAGAYGHDRFKAGAGGCSYTFATVLNVTTLTISAGTLQQVIEGANLQSGAHKLSWVGTAQGRVDAGAYGASGVTGTAVGGTNQTVEFGVGTLTKVQYEFGSVVTPFEPRTYDVEFAMCQRYYQKSITQSLCAGNNATSAIIYSEIPLAVQMRATPTVVFSGYSNSNALGAVVNTAGVDRIKAQTTIVAGPAQGYSLFNWTADAEL